MPTHHTLTLTQPGSVVTRQLAYTQWGDPSNSRVLLCVHGLSRNGRDFDFLAQKMEATHRVICVDVAGRGKSDWLTDPAGYQYPVYLADILALLDALSVKEVDWVGTSMGGILAMMAAAQRPGMIRRLVLNDIGPFIPGAALDRIVTYVGKGTQFPSREAAEQELRARMSTFGLSQEQWQHVFAHSIVESGAGGYRLAYDPRIVRPLPLSVRVLGNLKHPSRWGKIPDIQLWPFWKAVTCPVLLVHGRLSDILTDETVQKMKETHPLLQYYPVEGVGHTPMLMEKEQIDVVQGFLRAV